MKGQELNSASAQSQPASIEATGDGSVSRRALLVIGAAVAVSAVVSTVTAGVADAALSAMEPPAAKAPVVELSGDDSEEDEASDGEFVLRYILM